MEKQNTLQTVERAIAFLEFVAAAPEPPSINDVSAALELNITTCYHLLRTLVGQNYINRDLNGRLALGEGVGALFSNYQRTRGVEANLDSIVKRITATTQETSFLSLRDGNKVVLKVLTEGTHQLRVAGLYVGLYGREYQRASGKAVLSQLDSKARKSMLETSLADLPDKERKKICKSLNSELKQTAERGWSIDDQATEKGIVAISVPIFDASGSVLGAMGIIAPVFRMDKSRDDFLSMLKASAVEANQRLKEIGDS